MRGNKDRSAELDLLHTALQLEVDTSSFYKQMVKELPTEGQTFFARFVEIEEGHLAIVQAEIDALTGLGFWFDVQEFALEGA
jgi:rubrerythrin